MNITFFRRGLGPLLLGLQCLTAVINASDFREPLTITNGPLRFLFEDPDDRMAVRFWSAAYNRFADKAFNEELGRNYLELPALFFGWSEFRACKILPNNRAYLGYSNYNPLLRTAKFRLRANYNEVGVFIGINCDYPFYSNKGCPGRIGIRASIPFKRCAINKIDTEGVKMGAQVEEVMMSRPMQRGATPQGAAANSTYVGSDDCVCMRLDFMEALVQSRDGNSFVNYNHQNTANVQLGASIASLNPGNILGTPTPTGTALDSASKDLSNQSVALIYCPEGKIPTEKPNFADPESDYFKSLPIDAGIADSGASNSFYVFDKAVTYKLLADEAAKDEQLVAKDQDEKASVWVVPFAQITSDPADPTKTELVIPGNGPLNTAKKLTSQIGQNIYEWLYSQDEEVEFKSFYADSVGDAKIEVYAEQNISDRLRIELSGTVVLPTGGKALYKSNPYQMYAGNGGHWEVAPGALIALKACDFISVKADAKYSFVLNAVEERGACFVGAKIKNIGPKVEADVKWRYFTGNVDINFTHPNTAAITGLVGYQFNYKHKEVLKYVVSDMESWLGKEYNKTNDCFVNAPFPLDEDLAVIYTNSISHKLRFESSFLLSGWMEFFCGGSWAFMGKNAMATIDAHVGFHVAF